MNPIAPCRRSPGRIRRHPDGEAPERQARRSRWMLASRLAGLAGRVVLAGVALAGRVDAEPLPRGEVIPEVAARHDPEQRYSLFLPANYNPERRWPVLFVLDPRGRARYAMDLFVGGAREHGWIVLSSYQSRSDTVPTVTVEAFKALLRDAESRFALDPRRYYLTGMSGTSHLSWHFATVLAPQVAGVIGCGGGLARHLEAPADEVPFAYYGLAGATDFNYQEMRRLDEALAERGAVHRLEIFDGRHGWPRDAAWTRAAVDWMELQAMRRGLTAPRDAWIEAQWSAAVAATSAAGPVRTFHRTRQLVRDFEGLREVAPYRARLAALESSAEVVRWRKKEKQLEGREAIYLRQRLGPWIVRLRSTDTAPPSLARSLVDLRIEPLRRQSLDAGDRQAADSAGRLLEATYSHASFYLPREFRQAGDVQRGELALRVAAMIFPQRPRAHWSLASLHAENGRLDKAFEALETAVALGSVDVARLENDPIWEPLRGDRRWQGLLVRLKGDGSPP